METSAGQGEHGTGKSVKGSIRKIPSESVIRLWRNFLRQCLIRGLEVDFCSLPFRKKLYRRSIKNPNPFPIWKIWFGLYAFGAGGGGRTRTNFNPFPSCEGRRGKANSRTSDFCISTHSPHARGDPAGTAALPPNGISIHSPHARGDDDRSAVCPIPKQDQNCPTDV